MEKDDIAIAIAAIAIAAIAVVLILGISWGASSVRRPAWDAGFEYGIRMYHSADSDMDVNYLRWEKSRG